MTNDVVGLSESGIGCTVSKIYVQCLECFQRVFKESKRFAWKYLVRKLKYTIVKKLFSIVI